MRPGPSVGVQPPIAAIRTLPEGLLAVHEAVEAPVGPFLAELTPTPRPGSRFTPLPAEGAEGARLSGIPLHPHATSTGERCVGAVGVPPPSGAAQLWQANDRAKKGGKG